MLVYCNKIVLFAADIRGTRVSPRFREQCLGLRWPFGGKSSRTIYIRKEMMTGCHSHICTCSELCTCPKGPHLH